MLFLNILLDIIAPIFVLITLGYLIQQKGHFDLQALTNILLYLVMPATLVVSLTKSELDPNFIWEKSFHLKLV